jgi:hypothetical protein
VTEESARATLGRIHLQKLAKASMDLMLIQQIPASIDWKATSGDLSPWKFSGYDFSHSSELEREDFVHFL